METKEKANGQVKTNGQINAEVQEQRKPQTPAFANNNPVNKESVKDKQEPEKPEAEKAEDKPQIKFEKVGLNLESTLKLVEELFRRKTQRDRLLETITNLEAFEVDQKTDPDQLDANHFQGCVLTIEDDARRKFTTKNPVIIFEVAQYVNSMCVKRLAEIEAEITIPA
ncbi:MAG TPA: hypothetical protein VGB63_04220 [Pedobacter sp.]|jgi:hypothetical protein